MQQRGEANTSEGIETDMKLLPAWLVFSLGSALFAGMTPILGKLGVTSMVAGALVIATG